MAAKNTFPLLHPLHGNTKLAGREGQRVGKNIYSSPLGSLSRFFVPGSWFKEQNKAKIRKIVSTSVILDIARLLISEITECPADHV